MGTLPPVTTVDPRNVHAAALLYAANHAELLHLTDVVDALAARWAERARGLGDDCAFIDAGGERLAVSLDLSIEGVHFRREWLSPAQIEDGRMRGKIDPGGRDLQQPVDPEAFTQLLCVAYQRIKQVDPDAAVLAPALSPTISLDPGPGPGTGLNDFIFLQRMYDSGAGQYFDIMSAQGYGLFSGPTDRRLRSRVVNFSRPMYIRDIMVKNGDAHKPIWISEMNWNAVPDSVADKRFGQVTLEQQARYLPLAYDRIRREWPWVGVAFTWFFKPATDAEKDQAKYYFRMVDPDFTPLPVYESFKAYATRK